MWKWLAAWVLLLWMPARGAEELTAGEIIRKAVEHRRGMTSYAEMAVTIHRPDWERSVVVRVWTEADKRTLVRVIEPDKDAGSGILVADGNMWSYSPKVDRVVQIKTPEMDQDWLGSDFSSRDVSKDTAILERYDHDLVKLLEQDGHQVYVVRSTPHEEEGVPWGSEVLHVRDDWVILEHQFRDPDDAVVKTLRTVEIGEADGRTIATVMRMSLEDAPEAWTQVTIGPVEFDLELPPELFTLSNLRNPRE